MDQHDAKPEPEPSHESGSEPNRAADDAADPRGLRRNIIGEMEYDRSWKEIRSAEMDVELRRADPAPAEWELKKGYQIGDRINYSVAVVAFDVRINSIAYASLLQLENSLAYGRDLPPDQRWALVRGAIRGLARLKPRDHVEVMLLRQIVIHESILMRMWEGLAVQGSDPIQRLMDPKFLRALSQISQQLQMFIAQFRRGRGQR